MPMPSIRALAFTCVVATLACTAAATTAPPGEAGAPPGPDTSQPFPIDRGDDGAATPGSYKGLPLRLVDNGAPVVTPVDGVIGLVCIGMSNGNQECDDFQRRVLADYAGQLNPAVRVVNCAVGGHAIEKWIDPTYDDVLWDACVQHRLPAAGVRLDQVRVIWHKAADQFAATADGSALPPYPSPQSDFHDFTDHLTAFAARVKPHFPAVVAVYTSSRSYGGYAGNQASRGEPLSYEEGHALNAWLGTHSTVDGVWYGWGPYLWAPACASGVSNGSGVCYDRADYVDDGVHPSPSGRAKVSAMLHARLRQESWYR